MYFTRLIATDVGCFCYMLLGLRFCSANVLNQLYICNLGMKFQFMYNKWRILPSKYINMKRNCLLHSPTSPLHLRHIHLYLLTYKALLTSVSIQPPTHPLPPTCTTLTLSIFP